MRVGHLPCWSFLAAAWLALPASAKTVRVFAAGAKLEVRYADTYQDYHDKMFALFDAAQPRRAELVQADAGDVASHLQPADPSAPALALVNFPEDVGLVAALIGTRGRGARIAAGHTVGVQAAFFSLAQTYAPQISYYQGLFPGQQPIRYLLLALTDTYYRAFYETFSALARTYGVYVAATANLAPAQRVTASDDPQLVALLRDPDEAQSRDYAYVAVSPQVYNSTFVFDPQGNILVSNPDGTVLHSPAETAGVLRGSFNKAYLTEDEEVTLPLAFGRVQDLDVLDTPVGRLGAVISKDAWMIDVNDRYAAKGANLILQPEAYSDWSYYATPWEPDGFKAGGFAQVQRNPGFLYNVTAAMTGNLAEVTFDGQSALIGKRLKGPAPALGTQTGWIGQNPDSGFLRIAPWIMDDPGIADPQLTLDARRMALAQAGAHLLPGAQLLCSTPATPGACRDGYRESVIHADVELPDGAGVIVPADTTARVPTAFGPNLQVNSGGGVTHQYAGVGAHGGNVYVTWQDDRSGYDNVFLAVSHDRGAHFVEQRVSDNPAGTVMELRPALGLSPDGHDLFIVWQEFCVGRDDDCGRIKLAHFGAGGAKIGGDLRVDQGAGGVGKWNPALTVRRDRSPLVAWVDERAPGPGGLRFEHIYFARGLDHGTRFGPNVRADAGVPVAGAAALDNKWAPAVAAGGRRIYVAWADFRNYNWDIYLAHSFYGTHFSPNVRIDDFPDLERLDDHPALAVDDRGLVHAVWADRRDTQGDTNVFYARSLDGGRTFSVNRQIDSSAVGFDADRDTPSNQWAPQVAVSGSDVLAVWQDNRLGNNDIFYVRSRDRGLSFDTDERVDDTGAGPSNQSRPALAVDGADPVGRTVYVVWEDDRNGTSDIFLARRPLS